MLAVISNQHLTKNNIRRKAGKCKTAHSSPPDYETRNIVSTSDGVSCAENDELDQYGVEIKHKIATECNEYLQTGECSLTSRPADSPDVVHVDENEVPDDVKTVLNTVY